MIVGRITTLSMQMDGNGEPFGVKVSKVFDKAKIDDIPIAQSTTAPWIQAASVVNRNYLQPSYKKIRDYVTDRWQDSQDYRDTGDFYRELQPMVSYKIKRLMRPCHKDVQITRLRFGHVRLGEKLCEIGQRPDP